MKRSAEAILNDLRECKRVLKEKNTEFIILKQELAENNETIEKQLNTWNIPETVYTSSSVEELVVEYDSNADCETVAAAGCSCIIKEEYVFTLTIDKKQHFFIASRWTGGNWDCDDFYKLCESDEEEEEEEEEEDIKWEFVMKQNDDKQCPLAASIISFGFYAIIKEGKAVFIH